jgi:hypothetical protein
MQFPVLSFDAIHPDVLTSPGNEVSVNIFIMSSEIIDFINMDDNARQIPFSGEKPSTR